MMKLWFFNHPPGSRKKQLGAAMMEVLGSVGIGATVLGGVVDQTNRYLDNTKATAAGEYHRIASEASAKFIADSTVDIGNAPQRFTWDQVKLKVPEAASLSDRNSYQEPLCLIGRKINGRKVGVLISADSPSGGESDPGKKNMRRSTMVASNNVATGRVTGNQASRGNVWKMDLSGWNAASLCGSSVEGAVVTNLELMNAYQDDDHLLHRKKVEDRPELNQMATHLDLGGNNINSIGQINATSVTANSVTATGTVQADQGFKLGNNVVIDQNRNITANILTANSYMTSQGIKIGGNWAVDEQRRATFMGGVGGGGDTHFPRVGDGRNYIRGTTIIADGGGNLGVGTGNPVYKLHVGGDSGIDGKLNFGTATRQMINLWSDQYGIGVQNGTTYFRTGGDFQFYRGGAHSNTQGDAGGGTAILTLKDSGNIGIGTTAPSQRLHVSGGNMTLQSDYPTIYFRDTNARSGMLHVNDNLMYFLRGCGVDIEGWCPTNGAWPLILNLENNRADFGGDVGLRNSLYVSTGNATGGGIVLADDGDIVDLNDGYASMRFSQGVRVFSANRGGSPVITLDKSGNGLYEGYVETKGGFRVNGLQVISAGAHATFKGGSDGGGSQTHFPWEGDGKNYIRGTTIMADTGGRVGIGTQSPTATLHILRPTGGNTRETVQRWDWLPNSWGLKLDQYHVAGSHIQWEFNEQAQGVNYLTFRLGNVGVGTTTPTAKLDVAGQIRTTDHLTVNHGSPTIYLQDTDQRSAMLHVNSDRFYILGGGINSKNWSPVNGRWPLEITLWDNNAYFGGGIWSEGNRVFDGRVNAWQYSSDGRPRFYFANGGRTYFGSADGYEIRNSGDGWIGEIRNDGDWLAGRNMYANVYYDLNNGGYYLDPNGTSNLNAVTLAGNINWTTTTHGSNYIGIGTADNATLTQYNLAIKSWWGIGFPSYDNVNRIVLDTRSGSAHMLGTMRADSGFVVNGTSVIDSERRGYFKGGSGATGDTHFPWAGDGRNYIRGTTIMADTGGRVGIGTDNPLYTLHVAGDVYANWYRSAGNAGWYNETWGGGWYMEDSTWLRSYNNKSIRTGGLIRADSGFDVGGATVIDSGRNLVNINNANLSGNINWSAYGANYIGNGNADNATLTQYNLAIKSWWGIGFPSYDNVNRIVLDTRTGAARFEGTLTAGLTNEGQIRLRAGNNSPTAMLRNDGSDTYLLLTDSNNPDGTWNGLRPLAVNNATGNVRMQHNVTVDGNLGVGTTSPSAKLDVVGDVNSSGGFMVGAQRVIDNMRDAFFRVVNAVQVTMSSNGNAGNLIAMQDSGDNRITGLSRVVGKQGAEVNVAGTTVSVNAPLSVSGNITSTATVAGNNLKATQTVSVNGACSDNGAIAKTSEGYPVFCNGSKWTPFAGLQVKQYYYQYGKGTLATATCAEADEIAISGGGSCGFEDEPGQSPNLYAHMVQRSFRSGPRTWTLDCNDHREAPIPGYANGAGGYNNYNTNDGVNNTSKYTVTSDAYVVCIKASNSMAVINNGDQTLRTR